ncbi:MAG: amino acid ABC transporter permease [Desulfobacteraceae bacterium]
MLNKPPRRFTAIDAVAVMVLLAAVFFFFFRMNKVLSYQWEWEIIPGYFMFRDAASGELKANILLQGFITTVKLSVWALVLGFVLGTLSGMMGSSSSFFRRSVSRVYVETIRNIPSLVLVIIFYYFVSSQFLDMLHLDRWLRGMPEGFQGWFKAVLVGPEQINAFLSAVIALAVYEGAYISEIIRGGINGISVGQWEAAWSVGLSGVKTFRLVVLPQALARVASPLAGQFISTIKDSAIVSVISIQELTFQGMELMAATFLTFEIWITITALYFLPCFALSRAVAALEKKLALYS